MSPLRHWHHYKWPTTIECVFALLLLALPSCAADGCTLQRELLLLIAKWEERQPNCVALSLVYVRMYMYVCMYVCNASGMHLCLTICSYLLCCLPKWIHYPAMACCLNSVLIESYGLVVYEISLLDCARSE